MPITHIGFSDEDENEEEINENEDFGDLSDLDDGNNDDNNGKVVMELRAAQIQIMEGETTLQTFQKRVEAKKEKVALLNAELDRARAARIYLIHNKQLQFVLRRGLVEIPLSGDLYKDFRDAILIPKTEIEAVNNLINLDELDDQHVDNFTGSGSNQEFLRLQWKLIQSDVIATNDSEAGPSGSGPITTSSPVSPFPPAAPPHISFVISAHVAQPSVTQNLHGFAPILPHKWNLKFSGDKRGMSVTAFFERAR
ncbi:unnamed protein product [Ceutorhynchus assimilis]|uniref:Uncharacterized protein n=1 Tax=Ceutorhynchus assimilis TaxID=467358 RepID=A0A9N9MTL7_9CUCU|nr:unnamed protein product [Ceutorhynchus assimilis]